MNHVRRDESSSFETITGTPAPPINIQPNHLSSPLLPVNWDRAERSTRPPPSPETPRPQKRQHIADMGTSNFRIGNFINPGANSFPSQPPTQPLPLSSPVYWPSEDSREAVTDVVSSSAPKAMKLMQNLSNQAETSRHHPRPVSPPPPAPWTPSVPSPQHSRPRTSGFQTILANPFDFLTTTTAVPLIPPTPAPLTTSALCSHNSIIEANRANPTAQSSFTSTFDQLGVDSSCHLPPNQAAPISSVAQSLLIPIDPVFFLSDEQLQRELGRSRSGLEWQIWERQLIISELLGPSAPQLLILRLIDIPRKVRPDTAQCTDPYLTRLSKATFRGSRSVTAILNQIRVLVETYTEIISFAEQVGIDLGAPEFDNPEALICQIVAMWQQCVPSGGIWLSAGSKGLQAIDIVTWTHDPPRSWFSMIFSRLKEADILRPRRGTSVQPAPSVPLQLPSSMSSSQSRQTPEKGSDSAPIAPRSTTSLTCSPASAAHLVHPPESHEQLPQPPTSPTSPAFPASPVPPAPPVLSALPAPPASQVERTLSCSSKPLTGDQPRAVSPEGSPCAPNMLREQHAIASASVSLARAQAEYVRARTLQTRTDILQQLLGLEQQERALRLKVAIDVIRITEGNDVTRSAAQSWITRTFFTTHPSDDFTRLAATWKAELALGSSRFSGDSSCQAPSSQVRFPDSLEGSALFN